VSTDDQALGLEAQRNAIAAWASARGVQIVEWCTDEAVSGGAALDARPELLRALALVREHHAGCLVVAKRDRLARDVMVAAMVERLAADAGAAVLSVAGEGTDAPDNDDPSARLLRRMVDAFAEYERALISLRTRKALAAKRTRGEAISGNPPWGFMCSEGRWVPNEHEQRALALALELRAQGATFASIADSLAIAGFKTRSGRKFGRPGVFLMIKGAQERAAA
jgi:DNA invertase Pin-like site-specific DNA recombinase